MASGNVDEREMTSGVIPLRHASLPGRVKLPRRYEKAAMGSSGTPLHVRRVSLQPEPSGGPGAGPDTVLVRLHDLLAAVSWVKQELIQMRQHDILLKRQFLDIHHSIQALRKPSSSPLTPTTTTTTTTAPATTTIPIVTSAPTTTTTTTSTTIPNTDTNSTRLLPSITTTLTPAGPAPLLRRDANGVQHSVTGMDVSVTKEKAETAVQTCGPTSHLDAANCKITLNTMDTEDLILTPQTTDATDTKYSKDVTDSTNTTAINNANAWDSTTSLNTTNTVDSTLGEDCVNFGHYVFRTSASVTMLHCSDDSEEEEGEGEEVPGGSLFRPRTGSMRTSRDMEALARRRGSRELI